jgi:hypothetical protein
MHYEDILLVSFCLVCLLFELFFKSVSYSLATGFSKIMAHNFNMDVPILKLCMRP